MTGGTVAYHHGAWDEKLLEAIMTPVVPAINVDIASGLKTRKIDMILSKVYEIRNLDHGTKERVIDVLTTFVSRDAERLLDTRFTRELLEAMDEIPSLGRPLRQVISLVDRQTTEVQRAELFRRAVQLSRANVRLLYESVQEDIASARDDELAELILHKQAIYEVVKLLDAAYRQMTKRARMRKVPSDVARKTNMALYLLLRLEAHRLGKLGDDPIHDDLTVASLHTEPTIPAEMLGSIEDIIGILGT